jgi:hypothetical protein
MQRTITVSEALEIIEQHGMSRTRQAVRNWCRTSGGRLGRKVADRFVIFPDALELVLTGTHPADLPDRLAA